MRTSSSPYDTSFMWACLCRRSAHALLTIICAGILAACGQDEEDTYTVGGSISWNVGSIRMELQDSDGSILDELVLDAPINTFRFSAKLSDGTPYNVVVPDQPDGNFCTMTNGNGTISGTNITNVTVICSGLFVDSGTGLTWLQEPSLERFTWHQAAGVTDEIFNPDSISVCGSLDLADFSDWRLPTRRELFSITKHDVDDSMVNTSLFPFLGLGTNWSSTTHASASDVAWAVYFSIGTVSPQSKGNAFGVICVRGTSPPLPNFIDNTDGTVSDSTTGLMWQKEDDGVTRSWVNAQSYCDGLSLAGHDDWWLPKIKELISIVDDTRIDPAMGPVFSNAKWAYYWSSTSLEDDPLQAWPVRFSNGAMDNYVHFKSSLHFVRCAREG